MASTIETRLSELSSASFPVCACVLIPHWILTTLLVCCACLRQGFAMYSWVAWKSLCRPGWSQAHWVLSASVSWVLESVHHHTWLGNHFRILPLPSLCGNTLGLGWLGTNVQLGKGTPLPVHYSWSETWAHSFICHFIQFAISFASLSCSGLCVSSSRMIS